MKCEIFVVLTRNLIEGFDQVRYLLRKHIQTSDSKLLERDERKLDTNIYQTTEAQESLEMERHQDCRIR